MLFHWNRISISIDNLFKSNRDKCPLIVSTNQKAKVNKGEFNIESCDFQKLLGARLTIQ